MQLGTGGEYRAVHKCRNKKGKDTVLTLCEHYSGGCEHFVSEGIENDTTISQCVSVSATRDYNTLQMSIRHIFRFHIVTYLRVVMTMMLLH